MFQAILLSILAGIASALLSGAATPGSVLTMLFIFVAPLPLMIVGLGWHPLVAALGALIGCLIMNLGVSTSAAVSFAGMIGLPAWLACEGVLIVLMSRPKDESARSCGLRLGVGVLAPIGLYAVVMILAGALSIDFSYDDFHARLARMVDRVFRVLLESEAGPLPKTADLSGVAQLYASVMPAALAFLVCATVTLSLYLAIRVVRKSERLPFTPPPVFLVSLPRESLFIMVGCLALSRVPGWLGFIGTLGTVAVSFCFLMTGLAVMHFKTIGRKDRTLLLSIAWITMLIFGLPAAVFAFVGALDAAFNFRRLPGGASRPPVT